MKVGDCVALGLEIGGGEGHARGGRGVHAERVVDEVVAEARLLDFLLAQSLGELIHNCAYHLKMSELLCAYRSTSIKNFR